MKNTLLKLYTTMSQRYFTAIGKVQQVMFRQACWSIGDVHFNIEQIRTWIKYFYFIIHLTEYCICNW